MKRINRRKVRAITERTTRNALNRQQLNEIGLLPAIGMGYLTHKVGKKLLGGSVADNVRKAEQEHQQQQAQNNTLPQQNQTQNGNNSQQYPYGGGNQYNMPSYGMPPYGMPSYAAPMPYYPAPMPYYDPYMMGYNPYAYYGY